MAHEDLTKSPEKLSKLFEDAKPELDAVDPRNFVKRAVTRERVLSLSNTLLESWARMAERLLKELSQERADERRKELERLDSRAWVYYAADLAANEIYSDTARKHQAKLAREVAEHDDFLIKWAKPVFGDDPEHASTIADIARGRGARDDADDVLRLVALFNEHWAKLGSLQGVVTKERLATAEAQATEQLDILRNSASNPARKRARAAYALWFADYDELMQLGRYLSRREDDSIERFPGVRPLPSGKSSSSKDEQDPPASELGVDAQGQAEGQPENQPEPEPENQPEPAEATEP
ncbi:MAG: hypothetical protein R6X02_35925 [Enhygromyxa sp.]